MNDTGLFTESELKAIILASVGNGNSFTEADAERAYQWAHAMRVGEGLLNLVLEGQVTIGFDEGSDEPRFWAVKT